MNRSYLFVPGDSAAGAFETGRRLLALAPDVVRIYPTLVLAGSPLADQLTSGTYTPLSLETAVDITGQLFCLFSNGGVRVIRMGLQASSELDQGHAIAAGPYHPAFGQLVMSKLFFDGVCRAAESSDLSANTSSIAVNPRAVSNVRGQKNCNLAHLANRFPAHQIVVETDPALPETAVVVNAGEPVSILDGDPLI